jgi:hypothetical protein
MTDYMRHRAEPLPEEALLEQALLEEPLPEKVVSQEVVGEEAARNEAATAARSFKAFWSDLGETLKFTPTEARFVLGALSLVAGVVALIALVDLAARATLRLNSRWDTFAYHLPYAAVRGGLGIPYDMNDAMRAPFQGYPPLPHFIQGMLWRITGSVNATGVVNYLAFAGFLAYAQRFLRAPFWLVAMISLTAPLVIIHASVSYIDLFGNAFLAVGVCSCLHLFLFPDEPSRGVFVGGLAGLAAAAWSKYLLVPVAASVFAILTVLAWRRPRSAGTSRRNVACLLAVAALIAVAPYAKNWVVYGNPFWPIGVPIVGQHLPYTNDAIGHGFLEQPVQAREVSQPERFVSSLFEIDQPTSYPSRPRWTIDQGGTEVAFRMGGFWGVAACFYLIAVGASLIVCHGRRGVIAAAGAVGLLGLVAILPQSHQLRYYLFIPLSGAATLGMLFPRFGQLAPRVAPALLALILAFFLHMVFENRSHYTVERVDYLAAARAWGAADFWPKLQRGKTYCAIDLAPLGLMLTGPTMTEYRIVDRTNAALCPAGSVPLRRALSD